MVGTIAGGWIGYLTYVVGRRFWDEFSDGVRALQALNGPTTPLQRCQSSLSAAPTTC